MSLLLPGLIIGQPLVGQAGKAEPCVADPDPLTFISHDFRGDIDQRALPLGDHFSSPFPSMDEHQLV